jgi:hypothetical protein
MKANDIMKYKSLDSIPLVAGLALVFFSLLVGVPGAETAPLDDSEILTPDEIEEGMTGHGKTIFQGQSIDTFDITVKGVLSNALPDQDLILIEASHPILQNTQIMSGMSGSPIYVNGKLIGALAYSWSFAKEPIAGVTPIKKIFQARERGRTPSGGSNLQKIDLTLSTSGLGGRYRELLEKKLGSRGVSVRTVQSGSGEPAAAMASSDTSVFEPGDAIGAQLMSGDVSMSAIGTVTHASDGKVYAFGHPFLNSGRIELPMTTAKVHIPLPNLQSSFKLSSPIERVGTITTDRQAAIVGQLNSKPDMLPVNLHLDSEGRPFSDTYQVKVIRNKYLTPGLINTAASNLATTQMNQLGLNRVESHITLHLESGRDINIRKSSLVSGSFDPWAFLPLSNLWQNPFKTLKVKSVDIDMTMTPALEAALIQDVWLGSNTLKIGQKAKVFAKIKPYRGDAVVRSTTFKIPQTLAGDQARIHVVPGSRLKGLQAQPSSFTQLVDYINSGGMNNQLGVLIQIPELSFSASGHRLDNLPYSVSGTFVRVTKTNANYLPAALTHRLETDWILQGNKSLTIPIKD